MRCVRRQDGKLATEEAGLVNEAVAGLGERDVEAALLATRTARFTERPVKGIRFGHFKSQPSWSVDSDAAMYAVGAECRDTPVLTLPCDGSFIRNFHNGSNAAALPLPKFTSILLLIQYILCREKVWFASGCKSHPANSVAPAGSYRSGGGGNEAAGAFEKTGRASDSASSQAVTRVNVEQASKDFTWRPTRLYIGEGGRRWGNEAHAS